MATIAATPARIYVGTDKAQGMAIGLDAKKNVHLHRDKNLRLAIFVPERARASGLTGASHVSTGVSRAAYHQLRACSARSSQARQSAALQTSQEIFSSVPGLAERAGRLLFGQQMELAKRLADGRFEFAYQALPEHLQDQALALEVAGGPGDIALWRESLSLGAAIEGDSSAAASLRQARDALCNANSPADRAEARESLMGALAEAKTKVLGVFTSSLNQLALGDRTADGLAQDLMDKSVRDFALVPAGHWASRAIFKSVPGLPVAAAGLSPAQQIELSRRLADGSFEFAYQALPEDLQAQALPLELAGGPDDLALWHQSLTTAAVEGDESAAENLSQARDEFCKANSQADRTQARARLTSAVADANVKTLKAQRDHFAQMGLAGDVADAFAQRLFASNLAKFALTPAGHLMPAAYLEELAASLQGGSAFQGEPPSPALRGFLVGQLRALANQSDLRQQISSISAPPLDNVVIEDQLRADLNIVPPAAVTSASAREAVLRALLIPLRQGDVGSCFATSVAIRQQVDQPLAMVAQLKNMIERGYVEGKSGLRVERLPLNPGLGQRSPRLSLDADLQWLQVQMLRSAVVMALTRLSVGGSQDAGAALIDEILTRQLAQPGAGRNTLDGLVRGVLAEAMGLKFELVDASAAASERVQALLQRLRPMSSPADQLEILRTAIRDLNADIHRLSQAESVDDERIAQAIDDLQTMQDLLPAHFDLGAYEQAAGLAGARMQSLALGESRLLRTWEFSLASAGVGRQQQQEVHDTLVDGWLGPRLKDLSATEGAVSPATRGELTKQLQSRISERIKSDLVYLYVTETPQAQAADGRSSRGGWVLFDRGGAADPSQWRRLESEHDLRMTLRGLVRQVSAQMAQSLTSRASRDHVKALGQRLEADMHGAPFERAVNRTVDRPATFKADLVNSLVSIFLANRRRVPQLSEGSPHGGLAALIEKNATEEASRKMKEELSQCLSDRLVFEPDSAADGRTTWRVRDNQAVGSADHIRSQVELKAAIKVILTDAIGVFGRGDPYRTGRLKQAMVAVDNIDLSVTLNKLSPATDTSDAVVHRPLWNVDKGGFSSELLTWVGSEGANMPLLSSGAGRGPEDFFAELVTAVRSIRPDAAAAGQPILVSGNSHAFSLTPQDWLEALGSAAGDPKVWLQQRLGSGQHLRLADMNWGTGSHPRHLALGEVNGKIEFGWADGEAFHVSPRAQAYAQKKWDAWKGDSSGSRGSA
jgi:hypothetical protein